MSFTIRIGKKKDMQDVLRLVKELALFEKLPKEVIISADDLISDGFGDTPKFKTFIAVEDNGNVIGMALFYERYSTWKGKTIHLEDLMVTKTKRNIGAGKALYSAVLKYAYNNGYKRVAWEVLNWNKNAIDFYERSGALILNDWQVVHMTENNLKQFIQNN
ncbi:GNAT family N-acetyltransferase [Tenacibaculum maritimum]|uniref:GNAT family N-acetyltransferase n=1 Tax=Tenacibaculum maritimum TaxID=107401 RepID=UPI0012E6613E|nr:GNAT family N-acetyltransferase [Tenacibaculum maritimum]MCD9584728.1 GNAT family N-acetyltransferase [Tenacibaculum maritimum]MCD9619582.1 GNAT family N-acetyltransferase [Tenacibaculum maritimum]MCD9625784.1 GNAT family N-acetyltransferase [Tenacibaculum maritimum]MCD9630958.1 GNAT family N-acetyltransferase [Tenacibaculum maritimum]MCD9632131.1 GNAT family N-acetyltransferase [Tenacibaculum maritimum]